MILLIIVLFLVFGGGFWGYRSYTGQPAGAGPGLPVDLILIILVVLLLCGGLGGHLWGMY